MRENLSGSLLASWRAPFEVSYGRSFAHVKAIMGLEAELRLAAEGALALALDGATILFSERLRYLPETALLALVGHELAHTVQLARGGSDTAEFLEREAWRASWAALRGEPHPVLGGARQEAALPAVALVMDNNGSEYFKVFDTLASLKVTKTEVIKPLTYEKLLDLFLDTKYASEKDFVIQAHGTVLGFFIPITEITDKKDKTSKPAQAHTHILRTLITLDKLIKDFKDAGDDLAKLKAVLSRTPSAPVNDVAAAKSAISREIAIQKKRVGMDRDEDIARVAKKMSDVKAKQRTTIELRTCNMGGSQDTLNFFREQFNADSLAAPKVLSAFGSCRPDIGATAMKTFATKHAAKAALFNSGQDQFGFTYDEITAAFTANTFSAATNEAVINAFVTKSIMAPGKKFKPKDFPIHFLVTEPPLFPLNVGYQNLIVRVKRVP